MSEPFALMDVKAFHCGIPEIIQHMELAPLAPETERRQRRMHAFFHREHPAFHARLSAPRAELDAWKLLRLQRLVDWAYRSCPAYRERYAAVGFQPGALRSLHEFEQLPCIDKDDVIAGFPHGLPSSKIDLARCRWMSSSGSSGKQVQIVLPQRRADLDILFKYRMFEFMSGERLDPGRWLYNVHYCLWWHSSLLGELPVFSVTQDCDPRAVVEHVRKLRPQVVSSIGSYLRELTREDCELASSGVRLVSTNSETTTRRERESWSRQLGVPVRDEYSSEELDILAMECPHGRYHANEDDVHLELIDVDADGLGEVVGTDLWNRAMPMIRYRQGDLASWAESSAAPCACGSAFRVLHTLHGRADQALTSRVRGAIPPASMLDAVEACFCCEGSGIEEFRVIQLDYDRVEVLFVPAKNGEGVAGDVFRAFSARLEELFRHPVRLEPRAVDRIPSAGSYKRRTVINRMTPAEIGG